MRGSLLGVLSIVACTHAVAPGSVPAGATSSAVPAPTPLPQDRIAAIARDAQALEDSDAVASICDPWVDELIAIHRKHGERYGDALLYAAQIARRCGDRQRARATFELAARAKLPWIRAEGLVGIARLDRDAGDLEAAEQGLRTALQIDPGLEAAALDLAHVLLRRQNESPDRARFDEVQAIATAHLERREGDPQWLAVHARLHLVNARTDEASAGQAELTAQILMLLEDARARADAYYVLGMLRLRAGQDNEGLRALRRATHEDPEHAESWANMGLVLVRMRDFVGALEAFARAQRDPQLAADRDLRRARASAFASLGQFQRAQIVYDGLAQDHPADIACEFDLATISEARANVAADLPTKEQLLSDAARHYRAYLRGAPTEHVAERDRATAFLLEYATPLPSPENE